jgi:hypothetical protein
MTEEDDDKGWEKLHDIDETPEDATALGEEVKTSDDRVPPNNNTTQREDAADDK